MENIPMRYWAKDHWSTLAYLETRCVDYNGKVNIQNMRCNGNRFPEYQHMLEKWSDSCPTRLQPDAPENIIIMAKEHCDWACVDDFIEEGLVTFKSKNPPIVSFTNKGLNIVHLLRRHKCNGGNFSDFKWKNKV
jgi:hypothetical protein